METALFGPCVIRRVNERTLWAEIPEESEPTWSTRVRHVERDHRLDLLDTASGDIRLSTQDGALVDTLELEHRDVYRRPLIQATAAPAAAARAAPGCSARTAPQRRT